MSWSRDECEVVYRRYAPAAFRRAARMLGSQADADEVVHDVFLRLFEKPSAFAGDSRLSTYLYSAVTHACLNRLRNRQTRARLVDATKPALLRHDAGTAPEWTVEAHDLLRRLPGTLATVAVYYYLDELSQREIARLLGCSHVHVGKLLRDLDAFVVAQEMASC